MSMDRPRCAILIQARSNSERLPGKVFAPIPGEGAPTLIEHVFARMRAVDPEIPAYLLIPEGDQPLIHFATERALPFLLGPEADVRERYRRAVRELQLDWVVRATGDNPAVDVQAARETIAWMSSSKADLIAFSEMPLGAGVELFTAKALLDDDGPALPEDREHVSVHIKRDRQRFKVEHQPHPRFSPAEARNIRLTVDEAADLVVIRQVFAELGADFGLEEVFALAQRSPEIFANNRDVQHRHVPGLRAR